MSLSGFTKRYSNNNHGWLFEKMVGYVLTVGTGNLLVLLGDVRMRFKTILSVVLCSFGVAMLPAFSQGSNQAIFQDERQMELDNQARINGLSNQEQSVKQAAQAYDAKNEP